MSKIVEKDHSGFSTGLHRVLFEAVVEIFQFGNSSNKCLSDTTKCMVQRLYFKTKVLRRIIN